MAREISQVTGKALSNEADVDVKVSFRVLTRSPDGLGYPDENIRSQFYLSAVQIDKGSANRKFYKPDFLVYFQGLPVVVVEDKAPGEDLDKALRESQLYAHELNKFFSSGINPCIWCLVTDGTRLLIAKWDSGTAEVNCSVAELKVGHSTLTTVIDLIGIGALNQHASRLKALLRVFREQARKQIVGSNNEEVPHNKFGAQIVADYRTIFEPEDMKDREFIAKNAYIRSHHREQHADEIDRVMASAFNVSVPGSKPIRDTGRPDEIVSVLNRGRHLENQILLLVGRRGSGKTTFVDYLRVHRLPNDILDRTVWVHLNLNDAPKGKETLQAWVTKEIVVGLEASARDIDFNSSQVTRAVFSKEILELQSRVLFVYEEGSEAYNNKLADALYKWHTDFTVRARALKRYLATQRRKLLVIVFDNCDKRDRDDQLDCFEAARYIQREIECLIILPIRDVTYHLCKDVPPLDASANSLVFTISSPRLSKIISRRFELILEQMNVSSSQSKLEVKLAGTTVSYPKTELGYFLGALYKSLYVHDKLIRSVVLGLAGNNTRKAIKIFLEFIRSGFISEHYYLAIKASEGSYTLPESLVKQVLIRAGRQYFDEHSSFLQDVFQTKEGAGEFGNLLRPMILLTLDQIRSEKHQKNGTAFVLFSELHGTLTLAGFDEQHILDEVNQFLENGLLIADHQKSEVVGGRDRIRISPSRVLKKGVTG